MPSVTLVAGVSGSGKTTLVRALSLKYPDTVAVPVAFATRSPRKGERDGVDYRFISLEAYQTLVDEGVLLTDILYNSQRYGYSRVEFAQALESGRRILAPVDRTGVAQVRLVYPDAAAVFLDAAPDVQRGRIGGRETAGAVQARLAISQDEREWAHQNAQTITLVPSGLELEEIVRILELIIFR